MNSSKCEEAPDEKMLEKEHKHGKKDETEDFAFCEAPEEREGDSPGTIEAGKRTCSEMERDSKQFSSGKRVKVAEEMKRQLADESSRHEPLCLSTSGATRDNLHGKSRISFRKPLFSISHRILEKKNTQNVEQQAGQVSGNLHNSSGHFSSTLLSPQENGFSEFFPSTDNSGQTWSKDSSISPLIEKMFFILNSLSSSMTQLHSKVDLLSLEVMRIKKQIKPAQMVAEFQPPPEYLLTSEELNPLMRQTSSAGELGCRLLVHLFPELFKARDCSHDCMATKRSLESLHLQLIRNYVEACYPSVKNNGVWKGECLPQINDFFNRFWAHRDMESARLLRKQTMAGDGIKAEHSPSYRLVNEQGRGEQLSQDNEQGSLAGMFNDQAAQDLDELSSPEDFVIFLMHRLFPELFEEGTKVPEGSNCLNGVGQQILDSDRMEIIKKYMETNFPDVPEESWLQVCLQHMDDAFDGPPSNGNASEPENLNDERYDLASMSEDISVLKLPEMCDNERPSRKPKKSLLSPVDFDNLEIPIPDFTVPREFLLSKEQLKCNYECSLSIGNFASRLLVHMFPELFTHENTRKMYNCSGSLGKKQLDPQRVNLIRHYVQLVYPRARNDRVWMLEFVGKLDERCRRRDTEQRRSYLQHRKGYAHDVEQEFFLNQIHPDGMREDPDIPTLPPEKSTKDFCKIPLDELIVSQPDFPVPPAYLLSDVEIREIVQQSLSVGNFAARLLVRLFPELFTQENLRLQYNHSGACNKKQLDPARLRLIRHYVETVYPVDKMEEVWHYECVPSIDERCRRPNRKKCDILKKAKRSNSVL
ncbi:BEN domain-containing protein 3 [Hippocampus comes]|uniref:BEN domain containing 3 n=1 Tax=Hippocampus comes TaxID=109280 RepID=A0A3Q2YU39_HIPCM|nr:PREDICTED: BEN domain-containing protein 3 [Hippocampus comes]XP_019731691.1 PREDICTED: BEN domain-containing protein 3 [Hippocampus comes]XP_019731692.1 PREDICTED: BEN domain-containing protein 3 [Hippocampus comes]XP_019731693.1 PREDICTED: BEN domain-containing protein 3 [Hippocampus comes]XP_019731694.1 PREDICTED: BEN domain-containing protein 3 [Hippocampus comes]XP_019731695.1 PREDICTED: BEN domain-containing protein 3 [Hippocampus comes]